MRNRVEPLEGTETNVVPNNDNPNRRKSTVPKIIMNIQKDSPIANKREFQSWYLYDAANGAYFYSASIYLPVLITVQAQYYAMTSYCAAQSNPTNCMKTGGFYVNPLSVGSCNAQVTSAVVNATTCAAVGGKWIPTLRLDATTVSFLGIDVSYGSFSSYCNTAGVILQLILYMLLGSFADHGPLRKMMFMFFNTIGVCTCLLTYFFGELYHYQYNGIMWILGTASFSFCVVFYNSYLSVLAANHYKLYQEKEKGASIEKQWELVKYLTHTESLKGYGIGFFGQLLFQLITIFVTFENVAPQGLKLMHLRTAIATSGLWILLLSTMTFLGLKSRPSPPLKQGESYIGLSLKQTLVTILSFKELPELGKYLGAFFIYSDGIQTIAATSSVFATIELGLNVKELTLGMIIVSLSSFISVHLWKFLLKQFSLQPKTILMANILIMCYIPISGIFMTTKLEYYIAIIVFGLVSGSEQSFSRSIYAQYIPSGHEAEYFSFYEVSDKGTAWLGPLIVGIIFSYTGSYRKGFVTMIGFFIIGAYMFSFFNPEKAEQQRIAYEEQHKNDH